MVLTRLWNQLDATGGCSWFGIRMESANVPTGVETPAERQQLDIIFSFFSASPSCRQALLTFLGTNHSPFIKKMGHLCLYYLLFFLYLYQAHKERGAIRAAYQWAASWSQGPMWAFRWRCEGVLAPSSDMGTPPRFCSLNAWAENPPFSTDPNSLSYSLSIWSVVVLKIFLGLDNWISYCW